MTFGALPRHKNQQMTEVVAFRKQLRLLFASCSSLFDWPHRLSLCRPMRPTGVGNFG